MTEALTSRPWEHGVVLGEHRPRTLAGALHEVARAVPDRIAVEDERHALTYRELVDAVDRVSRAVRAVEPGSDGPVSVVLEHGVEAVIALLGTIVAGRVAVPVEARDPVDRLRVIHEHAEATLAVAHRASIDTARSVARDGHVLVVEDADEGADIGADNGADAPLTPVRGHPSMVTFTSGSSGTPKGVVITGDTFVDNALRMGYAHALTPDDRVAVPGSLAFGAAHTRIFAALVAGARVCTYDLRERGPAAIPGWTNAHGVTWMLFVPSVLRALIDHAGVARMESIRLVTFGGEPLYGRDVRRARALFAPGTVFRNRLSSSETHGIAGRVVTADDERADAVIPVGTLEPWVEAHVVDDDGRPVAPGTAGRLVVIGDKLAAGYWKDPALTAERFFDVPDGRRGFRTSDLVRWRDDGLLEHVGRSDDRVKVRGAMVSPTEVERALGLVDGVEAGAVKAFPTDEGGTRLVAYAAPAQGTTPTPSSIRRALAESLPAHMVPSAVVILDAVPIGARGKLDRAELEEPAIVERPYREPHGDSLELAEIFASVLGVDRVGLDDDFFDLGGDSLAVVELLAAVADRFSVDLPASAVLEAPTVGQLSSRLSHRRPRDASPIVPLRTGVSTMPFVCVTGLGAPAISLRALSDAMKNDDFLAVQPRGLEERARPDHTIEAAARRNLVVLRAMQPRGPYALGGFSYGGMVAFEMACQLRAVGEQVALLVILDTAAPVGPPTVADRARARADALRAEAPPRPLQRAAFVAARTARFAITSAYAHAERRIALATVGLIPRRGYDQYQAFVRLNQLMAARYAPSAIFDGPVFLVRSSTSNGPTPDAASGLDADAIALDRRQLRDLGWSALVSGPITIADVAADHADLPRRPAVEHVAACVTDALAAARARVAAAG